MMVWMTATVTVVGAYARATREILRHEAIAGEAIEIITGILPADGLKRLPDGKQVIGLVARRDIKAGEVMTAAVLQVPPDVRAGDSVVLTVAVGSVRVSTQAIASASGHQGDVIRVVPEGGRAVKARVTGPRAVEINQ